MEFILRLFQCVMKVVYYFLLPWQEMIWPRKKDPHRIPPITNEILNWNLHQVIEKLKQRKITSRQLVKAYFDRLDEVNPYVNGIVKTRKTQALEDADEADRTIQENKHDLVALFKKQKLLGVPFTVKEAVGVAGFPQVVGSKSRERIICEEDGAVVLKLRAAGAIPLLVSANPEYCFSIETTSYTHGVCLNPYDSSRTSGGSSGGEGVLNACGASLFGIGSDIAGSVRIPCMFNGVFGHKPTGAVTCTNGHFPNSEGDNCAKMLQCGPITRFAGDMRLILSVISNKTSEYLKLDSKFEINQIQIFYAFGFDGVNGFLRQPNSTAVDDAINKAIVYFERQGIATYPMEFETELFNDTMEISLSAIASLEDFPFILNSSRNFKLTEALVHYALSYFGFRSKYTKEGMLFDIMRRAHAFMNQRKFEEYRIKGQKLRSHIIRTLGQYGVLFFPTFAESAIPHGSSLMYIWNIDYTLLFNVLELPSTHVPLGKDSNGMPVGFQVVSNAYHDNLCLRVAEELEREFGGWKAPSEDFSF